MSGSKSSDIVIESSSFKAQVLFEALDVLIKQYTISSYSQTILRTLITNKEADIINLADNYKDGHMDSVIDELFKYIVDYNACRCEELYAGCTLTEAQNSSRFERAATGNNSFNLVYSEIVFRDFGNILLKYAQPPINGVFYDLGSGSGRAVFSAAQYCDFKKCVGIEIVSTLYNASQSILTTYKEYFSSHSRRKTEISFVNADIADYNWSDGDLVFANSTSFTEELMQTLTKKADELKTGACFITMTKTLKSPNFKIVRSFNTEMSWGISTMFIHIKS